MVQMYAENEQNMNAVERVLTYAELRAEGARHTPQDPPPEWPAKGEIRFNKVSLTYREGLPLVLKSVDFHIHPGEKVGVVGRTGAGKSSLLQALFRYDYAIHSCGDADLLAELLRSKAARLRLTG